MNLKRSSIVPIVMALMVPMFFAQENAPPDSTDEEAMFGGDLIAPDTSTTAPGSEAGGRTASTDLTAGTLGVRFGGEFGFRGEEKILWSDAGVEDILNPDSTALSPSLFAGITMDARPDEHFRVFTSLELCYPFVESETRGATDIVRIREVFADWDWQNAAYFRVGKHTIHWGVGYFYSPADVLNLTPIDPEDPEAEREGPLSLKVTLPFGLNSVSLYAIVSDVADWSDIAAAAKAVFVLGDTELGVGGFYRDGVSPRAVLTATFPLWKTSWFAEGVASLGSDRNYIVEGDGGTLNVIAYPESLYFLAAAGFSLGLNDIFVDAEDITLVAQYLYNGTGYADPSVLLDPRVNALRASGSLLPSDLLGPGMHYATARLLWRDIFDLDLSASCAWTSNLSDGSGRIQPKLSCTLFDRLVLSASLSISHGEAGEEFAPRGADTVLLLAIEAGSGRF